MINDIYISNKLFFLVNILSILQNVNKHILTYLIFISNTI